MGTEDKFLKEQFGNKRPFKVPDGYFENLASQIMEKLPERDVKVAQKQKKPSVWRIYRYVAVAACLCAIMFSVLIYLDKAQKGVSPELQSSVTYDSYYDVVDYVTDYGMMDNDDIYALLSEN